MIGLDNIGLDNGLWSSFRQHLAHPYGKGKGLRGLGWAIVGAIALYLSLPRQTAAAQSIIAAPDGTATIVTPNGDRLTIGGGSTSADGQNLFHSFTQFGLQPHEVAQFLAQPQHRNILARVVGSDPSIIQGLIEVTGGSPNLYLMNPVGIVLGANAQLNVPADFTATTATGLEFSQGLWTSETQGYAALGGEPQAFVFTDASSGAIANAGDLHVSAGQTLNLVGGSVLNTGTLTATGGNLQIIGVPGTNRVKISQPDQLLSLEINPAVPGEPLTHLNPLDLPQLLTGGGLTPDAMGVEFRDDGQLYVPGGTLPIPTSPGSVTITGQLDASTTQATATTPSLNIEGDKIALLGAEIDASGASGGGRIRIGERAKRTFVDRDSLIRADASGNQGNGGDILVWADEVTAFYGQLSVQGGAQSGDGGFVEVSARDHLAYDGQAHLDAPGGEVGTLFLDPTNITVMLSGLEPDDGNLPNIFASDAPLANYSISHTALNAQTGTVILEASNTININAPLGLSASHLILRAPQVNINFNLTGVSFTIAANESAINNTVQGDNTGTLTLTTFSATENLRFGDTGDDGGSHDIEDAEIANFSNFDQIILGSAGNSGAATLVDTAAVQTALPSATFSIAGAGTLTGFDADTIWELTGAGQGQLTTSGNTLSFSNITTGITGGSANDTVIFNDGVDFNGVLDGGGGVNTLDYSRYTTPVTVDLAASQATGTLGVFNFQDATLPTNLTSISIDFFSRLPSGLQPSLNGNVGSQDLILPNRDAIARLLDRGDIAAAIAGLEDLFSREITDYLGKSDQGQRLSLGDIQGILQKQSTTTGSPSALIYALVRSQSLELILVPEMTQPLHYRVPIPDRQLLATVSRFRQEVTDPVRRLTTSYLPPAQQLHQWLIEPLQADLDRLGIETLIFSLDQGLRALPLAALHNGQQFLVETYELGVVPSLSLTRTTRTSRTDARVLAMGAAEFQHQPPLPAVPVELAAVTEAMTSNVSLLNDTFTWQNWQQQQQAPFNVVHIATHAEFRPGRVDNSYLQLWDSQVGLDQLGEIPWQDQAVELLVLSACRTAFGSTEAEFGFAGLAVQTGVPTAIASIWYAHDLGTLALMSEFYQNLSQHSTRAGALRQAQLALLQGQTQIQAGQLTSAKGTTSLQSLGALGDRSLHHPYYWSGFTLIGSPW
ncbi:MAG: CHAT domain-containing protein [Cyanobacteria bacterium P01_G01_bin.54]